MGGGGEKRLRPTLLLDSVNFGGIMVPSNFYRNAADNFLHLIFPAEVVFLKVSQTKL
jgi:hypothetical protein